MKEYSMNEFLNMLLPEEEVIFKLFDVPYAAKTNSIKWVKTILVGDSATGKTELARRLTEEVVKRFKPELLEAVIVPRELMDDFFNMPYFLPKKPIKAVFFDDTADKALKPKQKDNWHRMRHIVKERTHGERNGLILTFLATQDYFSLAKGLRTNYHCLIAKGGPQNESDERFFKRSFGDEGLSMLHQYTFDSLHGKQECEFAVFKMMGVTGWFKTPAAEHDYFTEFKYLSG